MTRRVLVVAVLSLLILALAGSAQAWQGRMGGMGDSYGLVADEADFLTHPAKIVTGEGVRFYGDYRFTYTGVTNWDYELERFDTGGTLQYSCDYDTSGEEFQHEALVGATFPLGSGRMGVLFAYTGRNGDYDGDEQYYDGSNHYLKHELDEQVDDFSLRVLYGLPLGGVKLGGEVEVAYRQEEQETWQTYGTSTGLLNYPGGGSEPYYNLLPFMLPYDSAYWEALFKGSLTGQVGPLDCAFTLRGGFIFGSNNDLNYDYQSPVGTSSYGFDLDGGVDGWRIGGDLWVRYPLAGGLSLPFLVRVDYQATTRDGDGVDTAGYGHPHDYEHEERSLQVEVGGGMDKEFSAGTRIAGGIYYGLLRGSDDLWIWGDEGSGEFTYDYSDYPVATEHRVLLRFSGEREVSPLFTLRAGLSAFYGWLDEDFEFTRTWSGSNYTDDISLAGSHWGIGASVGGSITVQSMTLEPFITAAWQQYDLDGDGDRVENGSLTYLYEMDRSRDEWAIGGGLSVLFDL